MSCVEKDRFYLGEYKNEQIKLTVHSQMSNKLECWFELNCSKDFYNSCDSAVLYDQNLEQIQTILNNDSESKFEFNVANSIEIYNQNKVLYAVFYKVKLRIGKAKFVREKDYHFERFRGH